MTLKKILIVGLLLVSTVAAGWFLWGSNTVNYAADISEDVATLETELAVLEQAIAAGTVTPEQAYVAREKIVARLASAQSTAGLTLLEKLTPKQREELYTSLDRLNQMLLSYGETLRAIDAVADQSERAEADRQSGRTPISIVSSVVDIVDTLEEQFDEAYESETLLEEVLGDEAGTDTATSTDDGDSTAEELEDEEVSRDEVEPSEAAESAEEDDTSSVTPADEEAETVEEPVNNN